MSTLADVIRGMAIPSAPSFVATPHYLPDLSHVRPAAQIVAEANYASVFYQQLMEFILEFEAALDPEHEVGVRLVTFGQNIEFHLQRIGFHNPSLITFYGISNEGDPVQLVQHVSQISVLLMNLPLRPGSTKKSIGFRAAALDAEGESNNA